PGGWVGCLVVAVHRLPASEPAAGPRRRWRRGQGSTTRGHRQSRYLPWRALGHAIHPWRADAGRPAGKEMIMTEDKARKIATRQRMAETGEPYSVARHAVEREQAEDQPAPDSVAPDLDDGDWDEAGLSAQERLDRARLVADQARERAERARERAEQEEQEQARRRASQARAAAEEAQRRADRAEHEADLAEEQADLAEEQANLAEEEACHAEGEAGEAEDEAGEFGGWPRHRARQVHYHQG